MPVQEYFEDIYDEQTMEMFYNPQALAQDGLSIVDSLPRNPQPCRKRWGKAGNKRLETDESLMQRIIEHKIEGGNRIDIRDLESSVQNGQVPRLPTLAEIEQDWCEYSIRTPVLSSY